MSGMLYAHTISTHTHQYVLYTVSHNQAHCSSCMASTRSSTGSIMDGFGSSEVKGNNV